VGQKQYKEKLSIACSYCGVWTVIETGTQSYIQTQGRWNCIAQQNPSYY